MGLIPFGFSNSTSVTTSKVRHPPAGGVSARTGNALERAQIAQIELFARKKSRRFIIRLESTYIMTLCLPARLHLMDEALAHRTVETLALNHCLYWDAHGRRGPSAFNGNALSPPKDEQYPGFCPGNGSAVRSPALPWQPGSGLANKRPARIEN